MAVSRVWDEGWGTNEGADVQQELAFRTVGEFNGFEFHPTLPPHSKEIGWITL